MRRTVAGRRGLAQAIWAKNDPGEVGREGLRPDGGLHWGRFFGGRRVKRIRFGGGGGQKTSLQFVLGEGEDKRPLCNSFWGRGRVKDLFAIRFGGGGG